MAETDQIPPIDTPYLVRTLSRLATIPTDVPLGFNTLMEPDDPKLVHYVQEVIRPELVEIGCFDLEDAPGNNLIARLGAGESDASLILLNYTPAQHHNLMEQPFSGKVASARAFGDDRPAVFGQGVSQNKVHQAVMLAVLKAMVGHRVALRGRLYWAVNNEGLSSHHCTNAILDTLPVRPGFGVVQIPTRFQISLGNRGRVDVDVHVHGRAAHSSAPEEGLSVIEGAAEVVHRLKRLSWPDVHPLLGERQAIVYKIRYEPVAPHTLPAHAHLTVDRRLLPGDDPEAAATEVRGVLGDMAPFGITVSPGVVMLPALVEPDHPGVAVLNRAHQAVIGSAAQRSYFRGSFDAGGLCARGVPAVMYGAGGGDWPLGPDFVAIEDAVREAKILAGLVVGYLA